MTNRPAAYNRGNHEVRLHHSLAGRSCCVSARGLGAQPGAGIDVSVPCCATKWSASASGDTTRTVSAGSFLSAKDKRHSCIGDHAGHEWGDHDGFGFKPGNRRMRLRRMRRQRALAPIRQHRRMNRSSPCARRSAKSTWFLPSRTSTATTSRT